MSKTIAYGLGGFLLGMAGVLTVGAFAQSRPLQYKVVDAPEGSMGEVAPPAVLENILNEHAAQGWRLHGFNPHGWMIFERK
jgi:hypothetical protein